MTVNKLLEIIYPKAWIRSVILSMLFFNGCAEHKSFSHTADVMPLLDSSKKFSIEKSIIRIDNDTNESLIVYYTYSNFENKATITDLTNRYSLNIVNLKDSSRSSKKLPNEIIEILEKAMPFVQLCQMNDSIYYFRAQNILIEFNVQSSSYKSKKIDLPVDFDNVKYRISTNTSQNFGFPMYYENGFINFATFLIDKKNDNWTVLNNNYPYEVSISLDSGSSYLSKVDFPQFVTNNYYSLRFDIYRTHTDKIDVLGFPFTANIYLKNNSDEQLKIIGGKSKFQTGDFIRPICDISKKGSITRDSSWYYFLHSEYYSELIYNTKLQQYYRLYHHELSKKNSDGFYNTHRDRVISIQIFNSNFKLVHEEVLKGIWGVHKFLPYENGFVINNNGVDAKKDHYEYVYYHVK